MNNINMLVRGVPRNIHGRIQKMASHENLSVNQIVIRAIVSYVKKTGEQREKEEREAEAYFRMQDLREKIYRKHGLLDDSTKLIREDRDNR